MTDRMLGAVLAFYVVAGAIAFGHCAARTEQRMAARDCTVARESGAVPADGCRGVPGLSGFMAATFWPLYLSWELQK